MARGAGYHQKAKSAAAKEANIQQAVSRYQDGTFTSFSAAANAFGLSQSRTTIWRRINNILVFLCNILDL